MRIDRLRRLPGYRDPRADCYSLYDLSGIPASFVFRLGNSMWTFLASCIAFCISPIVSGLGFYSKDAQAMWADDNYACPETIHAGLGLYSRFPEPEVDALSDDDPRDPSPDISADSYPVSCLSYGALLRLRGGCHSDDDDSEDNADENKEPESDSASLSGKRKRKPAQPPRPTKRSRKGKETAIRVTLGGKNGTKGMFVDEESYFYDALEFWDVPARRVAIILDVSDTPECLQGDRKLMSVDAYIKKQCQDAWTGPTGSKKTGLALVTILDVGKVIQCRRSNLKCNSFYTCSLASPDLLLGFERWDVESDTATQELISGPMFASKNAEGIDIVAIATAYIHFIRAIRVLKSDVLDATLHRIVYGTSDPIDVPMYPVGDPDDDILASDPYTPS
ncbi:hypothetical protein C8R45DRAFT_1098901 [Mycena sanguinolenta]|nr:hypothetical protein C8R45DRAFT_1098901 [Mycena sanguinolenta]